MVTRYEQFKAGDPEAYEISQMFQQLMWERGIAWHNPFANECVPDGSCCTTRGKKAYIRIPSHEFLLHSVLREYGVRHQQLPKRIDDFYFNFAEGWFERLIFDPRGFQKFEKKMFEHGIRK